MNHFFVKYSLFTGLVFLIALILNTSTDNGLPIYTEHEVKIVEPVYETNDYNLYVSDSFHNLFPLSVTIQKTDEQILSYYTIMNATDDWIYTTFSLLTNYSNYLPSGAMTFIPQSTMLLHYSLEDGSLVLNVSREFNNLKQSDEKAILTLLTHTYMKQGEVTDVSVLCEGMPIKMGMTTETYPLNPLFMTTDLVEIEPLFVYYYLVVHETSYLVPMTIYEKSTQTKTDMIWSFLTVPIKEPFYTTFTTESSIPDTFTLLQLEQYYYTFKDNDLFTTLFPEPIQEINPIVIKI